MSDTEMHTAIHSVAPFGVSPIVRLPSGDGWLIKRALDAGAHGIAIPMVSTPVSDCIMNFCYKKSCTIRRYRKRQLLLRRQHGFRPRACAGLDRLIRVMRLAGLLTRNIDA